jgi:hypothetical protein
MTLHFMSEKDLSRVEILRDLTDGRLTVSTANDKRHQAGAGTGLQGHLNR